MIHTLPDVLLQRVDQLVCCERRRRISEKCQQVRDIFGTQLQGARCAARCAAWLLCHTVDVLLMLDRTWREGLFVLCRHNRPSIADCNAFDMGGPDSAIVIACEGVVDIRREVLRVHGV